MEDNKLRPTFVRFGREDVGTPFISESFGTQKWIKFGDDNLYPQEMIRLYQNSSALHAELINKKARMTAGNGWDRDRIQDEVVERFFKNPFSDDDLDEIVHKCAIDLWLFGGFYLNVIWNKAGDKIARIDHVPYEKMRFAKPNDEIGDSYYFSRDWENYRKSINEPKHMIGFGEDNVELSKDQIMFSKFYSAGFDYYSAPTYTQIINWLKMEYEISVYHLKNIQNGMYPSMVIINKSGIPTQEERDEDYWSVTSRYGGADNAGDIIMVYAESDESAPEFLPIEPNDSDERFRDMMQAINQKIMTNHGANPAVSGIETAGKLGGRKEIEESFERFQVDVIAPAQKLIERTFNRLLGINTGNEMEDTLKLNTYTPFFEEEIENEVSVDKEAEARAQLRGSVGGVQGILQIQQSVAEGLTDEQSAIAVLNLIYGLSDAEARRIVGEPKIKEENDEIQNNEE